MKLAFFIVSTLFFSFSSLAQGITGTWISVDDGDGMDSGHIEITENDGKYTAKIIKVLRDDAEAVCIACKGDKKDQPIVGLEIIWGLKKKGEEYKGGKILDPKNGKVYKCKLKLEDDGRLAVRGFLGFSLLGRTQYWKRME